MELFEYGAQSGAPDSVADQRILDSLSESDWKRLLTHVERLTFRAGDLLIRAGEIDRSLLILLEGTVSVFGVVEDEKVALASFTEGSVIGEIAFFDGEARSADVQATTDGIAIRISREKFGHLSAWEPDLAHTVLMDLGSVLATRLRATTKALNDSLTP